MTNNEITKSVEKETKEVHIDWIEVMKEYSLTPENLAEELFATVTALLENQMKENQPTIALEMNGYFLSLTKRDEKQKRPKYEH